MSSKTRESPLLFRLIFRFRATRLMAIRQPPRSAKNITCDRRTLVPREMKLNRLYRLLTFADETAAVVEANNFVRVHRQLAWSELGTCSRYECKRSNDQQSVTVHCAWFDLLLSCSHCHRPEGKKKNEKQKSINSIEIENNENQQTHIVSSSSKF